MSADRTPVRLSRAALGLCALAALIAVIALVGHLIGNQRLTTLLPGRPATQMSTAAFILLAAAGVALQQGDSRERVRRLSSQLLGAAVLLFGILVNVEYVLGVDLPIDWRWAVVPSQWPHPGRPSPVTATAFAALGAALLLFDVKAARRAAAREALCLSALFLAFVSLVGHAFGAGALYRLGGSKVIGVSLLTGLALSALGVAALLGRPRVGLMLIATSSGPGGVLLRRLGLTTLLAGPVLGALLLALFNATGFLDLPILLALGNVVAVCFALLLLVTTARPLERSHEAAKASATRVKELYEQAPEGIFIADIAGRYIEVNEAGCRLLDLSREEILGKTIVDLLPEGDVERLWQSREVLLQGAVQVAEWNLRRRDGSYVPVEVTAKILPDGRWQGFVRDITERLDLKQKLSVSRDFLEQVLESSTEYAIIAEDLERRVLLWNEGARRTYGYERDEISGKRSDALVAPTERNVWEALHERGLEQGSAEGIALAQRKDGTTFAANVVCTRRVGPDERTAGVLIVSRDLTAEQRYLAEQEFLARVGVELASGLEVGETLTRVAQLAASFLGDIATLDVLKDGQLQRARVLHRKPGEVEVVTAIRQVGAARIAGHPLQTVVETRRPVLLGQITDEDRKDFAASEQHARVLDEVRATSAMLIPLIARGQLLAVLSIAACGGSRRYGQADLRLAEELARRAALALDNAQLFQQSRLQGAMTTHLAEGVVLIRAADAKIVYANRRFETLFGYEPGELVGQSAAVLNAEDRISPEARAAEIIGQVQRMGTWHGEIKNARKDRTEFWSYVSVSSFEHEEYGTVWISVHMDITEQKRLEQKNAQALRDKDVLLKEIHHRVKNNLQVISSLFSLQKERTHSPELKTLLDESGTRVQSIALVHEQLYRSAELAAIDFDEYLRSLASAIRSSYGAERIEIEVSATGVVLDMEEAVPCALLVCELVSNSLRHAFAGGAGRVRVVARRDDQGRCILEVADDGRGIAPDFDWRKASSLGLRLVLSLARQLRGTVELDRSKGTCFTVTFGLRSAAGASARAALPAGSALA